MSRNPSRPTCTCGKGKVSIWDGRCGHCRTRREERAVNDARRAYYAEAEGKGE